MSSEQPVKHPTHFDIEKIAEALFQEPFRSRLLRGYGIDAEPISPRELCELVWKHFDQSSQPSESRPAPSRQQVFRAAARSLASNSRNWSTFLKHEERFEEFIDQGPEALASADQEQLAKRLASCLPGLTSGSDARAVIAWARLLHTEPDWGDELELLRRDLRSQAGDLAHDNLDLPLVAITIGDPRSNMKAPGMGAVLAAEFLRNLHWPGYKPDRHVIRLVKRWAPEVVEGQEKHADTLMRVLGQRSKDVRDFLTVSLAALELTPADSDPSQVDNLVWALGAMVEKKGAESDCAYLT